MKKLITTLVVVAAITASATITKVLNAVAVNGATNSTSFSAAVGIIPSQSIIVDTTGAQTNYLQASLDGTNFVTLATNVVSGSGTTNLQPSVATQTIYYRVSLLTTNNTTNTIYFSN
jgi:hypothetical protein